MIHICVNVCVYIWRIWYIVCKRNTASTENIILNCDSEICRIMPRVWPHQAISWTNAELSVRSNGINLKAISLDIPPPSITILAWQLLFQISFKSPRGWWVNSLRLSYAYIVYIYASVNLPSLILIMACNLVGAKPLSNQCGYIVNLTLRNKLQWNLNKNYTSSFKKMNFKMSSGKRQPFCLGLNV